MADMVKLVEAIREHSGMDLDEIREAGLHGAGHLRKGPVMLRMVGSSTLKAADLRRAGQLAYEYADPPRCGGYVLEVFHDGKIDWEHSSDELDPWCDCYGAVFVADEDGIAELESREGSSFQVLDSYGYREDEPLTKV